MAVYDRAFLIGPGFFAGVANGMILGYLMYRSAWVPRGLAMLGLIGGPLVVASGIAVMFDVIDRGSPVQGVATIPETVWELSFGIYLIVKGFRPSPILAEVCYAGPRPHRLVSAKHVLLFENWDTWLVTGSVAARERQSSEPDVVS